MAVTAQDVAALRQRTGAGMMDCKKALIEAAGDFEQAIDMLRGKGKKIAADRLARSAKEGAVFAAVAAGGKEGFLLVLNCETDFVAKNANFLQLGQAILEAVGTHKPDTIGALYTLPLGKGKVEDAITEAVGTMGEKIVISNYERLQGDLVVPYIHTGNNLGVLVALQGTQDEAGYRVGRDIGMQIVSMQPIALDKQQVDPLLVERERAILQEQVALEGHGMDKVDRIVAGRLNKFFQEHTLLLQPFVKNNKVTVAQYLHSISPDLQITSFKRVGVV